MELFVAIVGVVVAIASIVVSVFVTQRYRDRRELSYEIQPTPTLLSVDKAIEDHIEIRYEGREVKDLAGVTVTLRSTGNKAVKLPKDDSDYEEPIAIYFGEGTEIIGTPRVNKTVPDDLEVSLEEIDSTTIRVDPILLNPGQSISVFTLLTNLREEVQVNGHIEDTPPLKRVEAAQDFFLSEWVLPGIIGIVLLVIVAAIGGLVGWALFGREGIGSGVFVGFILPAVIFILWFLWGWLRSVFSKS
jgi:hypothetical protein